MVIKFNLLGHSKASKRKFLLIGFINVLLTNLLLQILLSLGLFLTYQATLISQIFNAILGYCTYGKIVFFSKSLLNTRQIFLYIMLMFFLWSINYFGINQITSLIRSKNVAALLMVLPLAVISYSYQKICIFKK